MNAILAAISAASLTDDEFDSLTIESAAYDSDTYEALLAILDSRETVSTTRDRLRFYFLSRGVQVDESTPAKSNIFGAAVLE